MKDQTITAEQLKEARKKYHGDIFIQINGEYYLYQETTPDPITARIETARAIVAQYEEENGGFDPFVILSGGETITEKTYCAAIEFLATIDAAAEKYKENTTFKIATFH